MPLYSTFHSIKKLTFIHKTSSKRILQANLRTYPSVLELISSALATNKLDSQQIILPLKSMSSHSQDTRVSIPSLLLIKQLSLIIMPIKQKYPANMSSNFINIPICTLCQILRRIQQISKHLTLRQTSTQLSIRLVITRVRLLLQ